MRLDYWFTANMSDTIPHLGLQIVRMFSNVYYVHLSLISIFMLLLS